MPTILRADGFSFRIYPNDHQPPHVHGYKAGAAVKLTIGAESEVLGIEGMRTSDVVKAAEIVEANWKTMMEHWRRFHG